MSWHKELARCVCGDTWIKGDLIRYPFEDWEFDSTRLVQRYLLWCPRCRFLHRRSSELHRPPEHFGVQIVLEKTGRVQNLRGSKADVFRFAERWARRNHSDVTVLMSGYIIYRLKATGERDHETYIRAMEEAALPMRRTSL